MPIPPCVLHEDDDLLVVNKPPGWNTHAPSPHAGEGIHDWLRHREPRWAGLAILHRLDKDTSGVLVFGKTTRANRALAAQFAGRDIDKRYRLVTDRAVPRTEFTVISRIRRRGDHYVSLPVAGAGDDGELAETRFRVVGRTRDRTHLEAVPVTGRTHQIRVHAAAEGLPLLGDALYGGSPANRLHLHAASLGLRHPATGEPLHFTAPPDFATSPAAQLRAACIDATSTTAWRELHGAADKNPGAYCDRLADWHLLEAASEPAITDVLRTPAGPAPGQSPAGVYFKPWRRDLRGVTVAAASPRLVAGTPAPERFTVREEGVAFELSLVEGYSTGLFLDQRDNRRRLRTGHVAGDFPLYTRRDDRHPEVLNCFAYTCGFSVAAALGGARTTSLDLSRKYLDWGRRNFRLNALDPAAHDFIYGDAFDWLRRLGRKGRRFDVIVLDPPTFSRSPGHGDFRSDRDYGELVSLALPLLAADGVVLASTNTARLAPAAFLDQVHAACQAAGRCISQEHYAPQPPDFPVSREEPAYLKTVWLRVAAP